MKLTELEYQTLQEVHTYAELKLRTDFHPPATAKESIANAFEMLQTADVEWTSPPGERGKFYYRDIKP